MGTILSDLVSSITWNNSILRSSGAKPKSAANEMESDVDGNPGAPPSGNPGAPLSGNPGALLSSYQGASPSGNPGAPLRPMHGVQKPISGKQRPISGAQKRDSGASRPESGALVAFQGNWNLGEEVREKEIAKTPGKKDKQVKS